MVTWRSCIASSRALCTLAGRAVDLVGEHQVGEDRAERHLELAELLVVDPRADDVGRHQVGRELDPLELDAERVARSVFTASVLASPGTPSTSRWPRATSATTIRSSSASWPTMTRLTWYSTSSRDHLWPVCGRRLGATLIWRGRRPLGRPWRWARRTRCRQSRRSLLALARPVTIPIT